MADLFELSDGTIINLSNVTWIKPIIAGRYLAYFIGCEDNDDKELCLVEEDYNRINELMKKREKSDRY